MEANRRMSKVSRLPLILLVIMALLVSTGYAPATARPFSPAAPPYLVDVPIDVPAGSFLINGVCPPGACTLREALAETNAAGGGMINFPGSGFVVTLLPPGVGGTLVVGSNVIIQGFPGAWVLIQDTGNTPTFLVTGSNSIITGLNIMGSGSDAISIVGNNNNILSNILSGNPSGAGIHISAGNGNIVAAGNTIGMLPGDTCSPNQYGIHLDGAAIGTVIQQNVISCNTQQGIYIDSVLATPVRNTMIVDNKIGTDTAGTTAKPNQLSGILDYQGVSTRIMTNLISGNALDGITLNQTRSSLVDTHNLIGTNAAGTAALPNGSVGIFLMDNTQTVVIDQNVISGNLGDGIYLNGATNTSNTITRNYIGVDSTGTVALGNGGDGIQIIQANGNTIGSLVPATGRNIISANTGHGINIEDTDGTHIYSNYIGLDLNGMLDLGNGGDGIHIAGPSSQFNHISKAATAEPLPEQFISCNQGDGIYFNDVQYSTIGPTTYIGVMADKTTACGNGGAGVNLEDVVDTNNVYAQIIAYNGLATGRPGIGVGGSGSSGNNIGPVQVGSTARMDIYGNGGLPIDLENDGHTPNDPGDTDGGPNSFLNYPEVTGFTATTVSGTVCNNCTVGVFRAFYNPAANGGGVSYLTSTIASGTTWTITIPTGYDLGDLTFLAYDVNTDNTSEMSPRPLAFLPMVFRP
jgi:hypothetical protein